MTRVTAHTRRKTIDKPCYICGLTIDKGERYRELVAVMEEWTDKDFERMTAHDYCCSDRMEWELTEERTRRTKREKAAAQQLVTLFNRAAPVGTPILIWPWVKEGEGRPSVVTKPGAHISASGTPMVRTQDGHIALTHVEISP